MKLRRGTERFVGFFGSAGLSQEQAFQSVELGGHFLGEILQICGLNDFDSFLEFFAILCHRARQLEVTFDLLLDLLEAVYNRHARDRVDATQRLQADFNQSVFPGNLSIVNDRLGRSVNS